MSQLQPSATAVTVPVGHASSKSPPKCPYATKEWTTRRLAAVAAPHQAHRVPPMSPGRSIYDEFVELYKARVPSKHELGCTKFAGLSIDPKPGRSLTIHQRPHIELAYR